MSKSNKSTSKKSKPTVVVTGASGFVGRYVVERLLQEDLAVCCLIRRQSRIQTFPANENLSFKIGDINLPSTLEKAFEGAWAVINIAGLREFWSKDRDEFYRLNHHGAENVFNACLKQNVARVIQVSTPLAYGAPADLPFNEQSAPGKHPSDYAYSKFLGDEAGTRLMEQQGLPLTIVYLAAVIGAGDDKSTMEVRRAVEEKMPALVGANTMYTYLYVRDAAEAITRALLNQQAIGKRYLIGKERATTREYFTIIGELANVPIPGFNISERLLMPVARVMEGVSRFSGKRPELPLDVLKTTAAGSLLFDCSLSERELGMKYTPLRQALAEAVDDIRQSA